MKKYDQEIIKVPRFKESNGFYTSEKRSKMMSKIKGKHTKPEKAFRKVLSSAGIYFRLHNPTLPGKPDFSNKSKRFVIFIDGEFWHGYNWEEKKEKIKTNRLFWVPKIERNMQRDANNNLELEQMGYRVFRFWEKQIKKDPDACVGQILDYLRDGK